MAVSYPGKFSCSSPWQFPQKMPDYSFAQAAVKEAIRKNPGCKEKILDRVKDK